ncbi:MAG: enoyl-CoA hydratase/isomerase family protein [Acidobacteriota bacterium]
MSYEQILTETRGPVRWLTLHRPEKLNAWTRQMANELASAIDEANEDPAIGTIVVTGSGRAFCAGADIEQAFGSRLEGQSEDPGRTRDWVAQVRSSKPLIAAINGVAVGVGITQVLPFDLLVAAEEAKVGMFFVRMGLVPELGSSHYLVQRVGFSLASEMCLSGHLYKATELVGTGFFNAVVPAEQLEEETQRRAEEIANNPEPALRMVKELLSVNGAETDLAEVQRRELEMLHRAYETPEHREAVAAFRERRAPDFRKARA